MIITKIVSGLGNQLFQWAAGRSLAERNRTELLLDLSFFEDETYSYDPAFPRPFRLNGFRITAGIATPAQIAAAPDFHRLTKTRRRCYSVLQRPRLRRFTPRVKEPSFGFHPEVLAAGNDVYLDGYWASEKYFASIAPIIRQEAQVADKKIEDFAGRYLQGHRKAGVPLIGVQVRRGDVYYLSEVLKKPELAPVALLKTDYFIRAMQHFGDRCSFLMFSDSEKDLRLCQEEFKGCKNITFVSGNDDLTDFTILQKCDHQIISNSTFGWWAAWQNPNSNKTVIAPRGWFTPSSPHVNTLGDLIPPSWALM